LNQTLLEKLKTIEDRVGEHFPEVLNSVKVELSVAAVLSFKNNPQPTTLIFSGTSGSGKTLPLSLILPDKNHKEELSKYIFRSDNFTPKSFVSHAANIGNKRLEEIDLLPKIENKVLIIKELAPIFRGKKEELVERFSILISVLDGKGLMSSSGSRGTRGYDRDINFCWLGGTTPLSSDTHKLMAQLGTRMLFYNTDRKDKSIDELLEFAMQNDNSFKEETCRKAVNEFLVEFFKIYPPNTFDVNTIKFDIRLLRKLVIYAKAMAMLRGAFSLTEGKDEDSDDDDRHGRPNIEREERAIIIMRNIAYGSALIHGRDHVNDFDLEQIRHIAFSSMPEQRRILFEAILKTGGSGNTKRMMELTGFSKKTVLHYMKEVGHLGICKFEQGDNAASSSVSLNDMFRELFEIDLEKNEKELHDYFDAKKKVFND